ncbi:MAG: HEAT repeat domain-containing protein [Bryobacteraceae bacterium]
MRKSCFLVLAIAAPLLAQDVSISVPDSSWTSSLAREFQSRSSEGRHEDRDREYQRGLSALDAHRWDRAIESFQAVADRKGSDADAALYWKAYAQSRAANRQDALSTIGELRREYPSSRWLSDAQALDVEVRAQAGSPVNPRTETDDEIKLMAINSLLQSDPSTAFPALQKVLAGNSSVKVKERALFVLTQNSSPEARKLLGTIAANSANPDLQMRAIRYVGLMGSEDARKELEGLYSRSNDERVKRAILQSFMRSGSRSFLVNIAKTEKNPELRADAIRQIALSGGQDELWQLYQSSTSKEDKDSILKSMFLSHNTARLGELARTEKDPQLRVTAIKSLGLIRDNSAGDTLVSIYKSDSNPEVKSAAINALFLQQNAKALIDIARTEKNQQFKEEAIRKMSLMHSKEVTDYMLEVLK